MVTCILGTLVILSISIGLGYRLGDDSGGSFPAVSLEHAREKAADIRKAAGEGRNILADRRAHKQGVVTFRQAFETFFTNKEPTLSNAKHRAQWRSTLEGYAFPIIGDRPVADVQPNEILTIMRPIWRSKPETAGARASAHRYRRCTLGRVANSLGRTKCGGIHRTKPN